MSDYLDILKEAKEKGILLDSCGLAERQYWNGLYNDLCGMSVEDALAVQYWHEEGGSSKKSNTIAFALQATTGSNYELVATPTYAPTAAVNATFTFNGTQHTVIIPAGSTSYSTGVFSTTKYGTLTNIALTSTDETYTYKSNNNVRDGKFNLTYVSATGSIISTEKVEFNTTVTLPDTPTEYKTGYTYYWHFQGSETPLVSSFTMPEQDTTIVGTAIVNQYTITYKISGETDIVKTYDYLEEIEKYTPIKTGYSFSGWDGTEPDRMPARNLVFNGYYTANNYILTYYVDGNIHSALTYHYNDVITAIANPTKEGYTFDGWQNVPATMPANNVRVDGAFSINSYTITYHIDGLPDTAKTYTYGATVVPFIPVKEGHTFQGWDEEEPATMPAQNLTLTGAFIANTYYITYYIDSEQYKQEAHNFGAEITIAEEPSKEGYTFSGWDEELPATMPSHNIDIHGTYSINSYKLTYYVDGIKGDEITYEYNAAITPAPYPTKEGYTFGGWSTIPSVMPAHDVDVYGIFTINSYTLTYKVDGTNYSAITYNYNADVTPIDAPTKIGYSFSGWDSVPSKMPAENVEVNGTFSINEHTLTYKVDGQVYSAITYEYNSAIKPIASPTKEGYTFSGWSNVPERMPDYDVTAEGTFAAILYNLIYKISGETYTFQTYTYGASITPVTAPAKEGYTFNKWEPTIPATMPANDLTVNGIYNINSHVAHYYISGETGEYSAVTYNYGATIIDPIPSERTGYTFAWDSHAVTMPDNDITINGKYSEVTTASEIYYGYILNNDTSAATPEQIKTFTHYNGITEKEKSFYALLSASTECIEWAAERDLAEEEERYDDAEELQEQIDNWVETHQYAFTMAIPSSITFSKLQESGLAERDTEVVKNMTIDGSPYVLRKYTSEGMKQGETDINLNFKIIVL